MNHNQGVLVSSQSRGDKERAYLSQSRGHEVINTPALYHLVIVMIPYRPYPHDDSQFFTLDIEDKKQVEF